MTSGSGWHVKEGILTELFEGSSIPSDRRILENKLCDLDIRDFGEPCLSNNLNKETLNGPVVLQLIRYRNVSQPKLKDGLNGSDDVGRMYLTDGHSSVSGVLLSKVKGISADTPPGTKLLISGVVKVENGFLILDSSNTTVIGGRVDKLIDKWMIERHSFGENELAVRSDSKAPRWISFGKNIRAVDPSTLKFRANDVLKTVNERNTNDESVFEQQRKENIQAVGEANAKVFIPPTVEAPLKSQKPCVPKETKPSASSRRDVQRPLKKKNGRRGGVNDDEEVPAAYARSSKPSTLFDFMTASVGSGIDPDSNELSRASTQDITLRNSEGKHSRRQQNHTSSDQQGVGRGRRKEKERDSGRMPVASVMNRQSKQDFRSGEGYRKKDDNHLRSSSPKKSQHLPDRIRNSVRAQTSKQVDHSSIYHQFQSGTSLNAGAHSSKSRTNISHGGSPTPDGIIQNFSNISIAHSNTNVPKKQFTSKSHRGSSMQKVPTWKVGDQCQAPWSDGQYYLATIVHMEPSGMCVVRYNDYGNTCTVPQGVLLFESP
ncbi:hypothetical protein KIN20_017756 [Parelaphostrongylus tenuis]|uniref:Survival of motor neuron-related-splicing factor 30 n=1 Tax=Parelaphostrongylus tenuis TaxID=148309 RepID=A0AAD5QR03_PARTN|nr:hypothetical protein KIN20_017756 [Parelaphostrongylus tenuis]